MSFFRWLWTRPCRHRDQSEPFQVNGVTHFHCGRCLRFINVDRYFEKQE